jgi:protein SCO1/2
MGRVSWTRQVAAALAVAGAALGSPVAHAGTGPSDPRLNAVKVLELSEAALGRQVAPYELTDAQGRRLSLGDYRGRPLVISLVYTSCSSICPTTTQHLLSAVRQARRALGGDRFAVLTVGFDARRDTPGRLSSFAEAQGIEGANWHVASGDEATLASLIQDLGFTYAAVAGGFEHVTQTSILDADGRVYRHVYGDDFPIQVFMEPLKELVFGTTTRALSPGAMIDRLKFLCTVYDPNLGRYRTSYAIAMGIVAGGSSLLVLGWILLGAWRRTIKFEQASRAGRSAG